MERTRPAADAPPLTDDEVRRYSRHLALPDVGVDGQRALKAARVLCIGAGGLGSPAAMYLAAAGVGTLGIVDFDVVDESNLQRQLLHGTSDLGRAKVDSAGDRLRGLNPHIHVETVQARLTSTNAMDLFAPYDVIVDGTDNFATRYLVNDACFLLGKPNVHGSVFRFEGQASVFCAKGGPCYRCMFPHPPAPGLAPSCAEGGVLGVLPGVIGTIQATETIKLVVGAGEPLVGRLLLFDALQMRFRELVIPKDPECVVCSARPTITALIDYDDFCGTAAPDSPARDIAPRELVALRERGADLVVLDVREPHELRINRIEGSVAIPLGELARRLGELDRSKGIVCQCKTGGRSARAAELLRGAGFRDVRNLTGGILRWIDEVDASLARY